MNYTRLIVSAMRLLFNSLDLPEQNEDYRSMHEFLEYGEEGLALGELCWIIKLSKIPVTIEQYNVIKDLIYVMKIENEAELLNDILVSKS